MPFWPQALRSAQRAQQSQDGVAMPLSALPGGYRPWTVEQQRENRFWEGDRYLTVYEIAIPDWLQFHTKPLSN